MRIVALSDTHIPYRVRRFPDTVFYAIEDQRPGLIIHCGDICAESVLDLLSAIAPVRAVTGNMDPPELSWKLRTQIVLPIGGRKVGVIHGHGGRDAFSVARGAFAKDEVDCVLFGHSHVPLIEESDGVLFVNPGSPTDYHRPYIKLKAPSFAVVDLGERITAKIRHVDRERHDASHHLPESTE